MWSIDNCTGFLVLLLVQLIIQVNCDNSSVNQVLIEKQTHLLTSGFSSIFWNHIHNSNRSTINVSDQCLSSLDTLRQSTLDGQLWALRFLSLSGSKPNDFLDGSYATFGSYDSCLDVNQQIKSTNHSDSGQAIRGQYCLTSLEPDLLRNGQSENHLLSQLYSHHFDSKFNLTIKVGLCIPDSCTPTDLHQLMNQALSDYSWRLVDINQCEVSETFFQRYSSANFGQKFFFWLLTTLIATVVWGTVLDIQSSTHQASKSKSSHTFWIKQFSAIKSLRSLFRKPDNSPKVIFLDQLRFTCVVIVITLHGVMWFSVVNAGFLTENSKKGIELYKRIEMQPLANDWITEGLIVVGGISSGTTLMKKLTPQTPISTYLRLIFRRAALLIPAMITVISIEVIMPLLGSGPIFKSINQFRSSICLKNFITNIFHVQNFCDPLEICASHTWSIAVEWQLFIMLSVAIYIYKRNYRLGLAFNLFMVVFGLYQSVQVIIRHNIIPHIIVTSARYRDIASRMGAYYVATEAHIWSYFLGLLTLVIMLGNYESKLGIILTKLRYQILLGLTVLLGFTSAPWNVFGMPIDLVTTIISSLILKGLMGLWCLLIILAHSKKFRRFLRNSKSNDIVIYNDEVENETQSTTNHETKEDGDSEKSSLHNNNNLNNNQESLASPSQPRVLQKSKALHRFEVVLRIYKSAYFIHAMVYAFYFTTLRTSLTYSFVNYVILGTSLTAMALFAGIIFYILILGPIERIQYITSSKSIKSKTT